VSEHFFAPCPRGLEAPLAAELDALGASGVTTTDGGAAFDGPIQLAYHANLESRLASRVLWRVGHGAYRDEQDVYDLAKALDWPRWFRVDRTLRVDVAASRSPLTSLEFATLRIKDAVCDRHRAAGGIRPSISKDRPDVRVHAYLTASEASFYLDTSLDLAPGLKRTFGFQKLAWYDGPAWQRIKQAAQRRAKPLTPLSIWASDDDATAIHQCSENIAAAGIEGTIVVERADALVRTAPAPVGVIVSNPPYGVRLADSGALAAFYPQLGDALKRRYAGWTAYLLSGDTRLPKLIGLKASRRTPLFNGALECRLYEYRMIAGSMRTPAGGRPE
jgi:putative N6-adenine-specific DNA methylase